MNIGPPMIRQFAPSIQARNTKEALLEFQFSIFRRIKNAYANKDNQEMERLSVELFKPVDIHLVKSEGKKWEFSSMSMIPIETFKHHKANDIIRVFPHKVWCLMDMVPHSHIYWNDVNNVASATEQEWAAHKNGPPEKNRESGNNNPGEGQEPYSFTTATLYSPSEKELEKMGDKAKRLDIDCAVISLLGIDRWYASMHFIPGFQREKSEIYHLDYYGLGDLDQYPTGQEFPRIVFVLGHLSVQGDTCTHWTGTSTHYYTPSWFAVVVDLERPERPVWLIRDLRGFGWTKRPPDYFPDSNSDSDSDSDESCYQSDHPPYFKENRNIPESARRYRPVEVNKFPYGESAAYSFFNRLAANDTDLIKIFSSVSEWDHAELDAATLKRYLFDANNRFQKTMPRLRRAIKGREIVYHDKDEAKYLIDQLPC